MDLLNVAYSEKKRPKTDYPKKLAFYLVERMQLAPGTVLLEIGCGRGEFLAGFKDAGLTVFGTDMCRSASDFSPDLDIRICELGHDRLPFPDQYFDVVFSKSLLEHINNPENYMMEALRVVKGGGGGGWSP
jgi:ubiquinone/menaquinone biosynthesis C-methylase UbiE